MNTKQLLICTCALVASTSAMGAGVYFVSGGDFRESDAVYVVETTEPNQTVEISPKTCNRQPWYYKTEGNQFTGQNGTRGAYTYAKSGRHIVKLYHDGTSNAQYTFNYTDAIPGNHIKLAKIGQNAGLSMEYTGLKSVSIDVNTNQLYWNSTFQGCSNLVEVIMADNVLAVAPNAFKNCTSLTNVHFSSNLTQIGNYAFMGCSSLESLDLPSSIASIGTYGFAVTGLKTVTWPGSITTIQPSMFNGCASLETIVLPEGVTSIGSNFAYNCKKLKNITLPSTLTQLGDYAFGYCSDITSLIVPASVDAIGKNCFFACTKMTSLTFLGKTLEQVQSMTNYPWSVNTSIINVGE